MSQQLNQEKLQKAFDGRPDIIGAITGAVARTHAPIAPFFETLPLCFIEIWTSANSANRWTSLDRAFQRDIRVC